MNDIIDIRNHGGTFGGGSQGLPESIFDEKKNFGFPTPVKHLNVGGLTTYLTAFAERDGIIAHQRGTSVIYIYRDGFEIDSISLQISTNSAVVLYFTENLDLLIIDPGAGTFGRIWVAKSKNNYIEVIEITVTNIQGWIGSYTFFETESTITMVGGNKEDLSLVIYKSNWTMSIKVFNNTNIRMAYTINSQSDKYQYNKKGYYITKVDVTSGAVLTNPLNLSTQASSNGYIADQGTQGGYGGGFMVYLGEIYLLGRASVGSGLRWSVFDLSTGVFKRHVSIINPMTAGSIAQTQFQEMGSNIRVVSQIKDICIFVTGRGTTYLNTLIAVDSKGKVLKYLSLGVDLSDQMLPTQSSIIPNYGILKYSQHLGQPVKFVNLGRGLK